MRYETHFGVRKRKPKVSNVKYPTQLQVYKNRIGAPGPEFGVNCMNIKTIGPRWRRAPGTLLFPPMKTLQRYIHATLFFKSNTC